MFSHYYGVNEFPIRAVLRRKISIRTKNIERFSGEVVTREQKGCSCSRGPIICSSRVRGQMVLWPKPDLEKSELRYHKNYFLSFLNLLRNKFVSCSGWPIWMRRRDLSPTWRLSWDLPSIEDKGLTSPWLCGYKNSFQSFSRLDVTVRLLTVMIRRHDTLEKWMQGSLVIDK